LKAYNSGKIRLEFVDSRVGHNGFQFENEAPEIQGTSFAALGPLLCPSCPTRTLRRKNDMNLMDERDGS